MGTERSAISMWDFSWLTRRDEPHAEYRDWDEVLDGLCERGYDCVRIDAFPHLVASDREGRLEERFTILPEPSSAQWGNKVPVTVEPRAALVEFMHKAKSRGLSVGLSTWFNPDTLKRRSEVRTPEDYARVWGETLRLLHEENLDDAIAWVDLCNEFPLGAWAHGAYPEIFDTRPGNMLPMLLPWSRSSRAAVQSYFTDAIGALKEEFPGHRYTFSTMFLMEGPVRKLDLSAFDLFEAHVWLTDRWRFSVPSLGLASMLQLPRSVPLHASAAPRLYLLMRDRWIALLARRMQRLSAWASKRDLDLLTTEGWATVIYDDLPGEGRHWDWLKDLCRQAVRLAIGYGWSGICTSNFSQPHFLGIWNDLAWHRELTGWIHDGWP
jgi:hypothetical protein